jgi:hypothetical protein
MRPGSNIAICWTASLFACACAFACTSATDRRRGRGTTARGALPSSPVAGKHRLDEARLRAHRRQCRARVARSCRALARHHGGPGAQRNLVRAAALYRLACALGSDRACFEIRAHQSNRTSSAAETFTLRIFYADALRGAARKSEIQRQVLRCFRGDGGRCAKAARLFEDGTGVRESESRARQLLRLACVQDPGAACDKLTQDHSDALGEVDPTGDLDQPTRPCPLCQTSTNMRC